MRVFNGIVKGTDKAIKALTKIFGIQADIYRPIGYDNPAHGVKDNDLIYEENPFYSGKVLIPYVFKKKNKTADIVDELFDDSDITMYLPTEITVPRYSRIRTSQNGKISAFIVNNILEINDGDRPIFNKYILVPDMRFNEDDKDEITQAIIEEIDQMIDRDLVPDKSDKDKEVEYDPIG